MYYPCSENKGADNFTVTVKLICAFVFAYAGIQFSHDVAYLRQTCRENLLIMYANDKLVLADQDLCKFCYIICLYYFIEKYF